MMTNIKAFEELPLFEQGLTILDKGELINTRFEEQYKIFLFDLEGYNIEVYLVPNDKRIDRIKILENKAVSSKNPILQL